MPSEVCMDRCMYNIMIWTGLPRSRGSAKMQAKKKSMGNYSNCVLNALPVLEERVLSTTSVRHSITTGTITTGK